MDTPGIFKAVHLSQTFPSSVLPSHSLGKLQQVKSKYSQFNVGKKGKLWVIMEAMKMTSSLMAC